jgi:hypothetical protein
MLEQLEELACTESKLKIREIVELAKEKWIERATEMSRKIPFGTVALREVSDRQAVLSAELPPTRTRAEESNEPKSFPVNVMGDPPCLALFVTTRVDFSHVQSPPAEQLKSLMLALAPLEQIFIVLNKVIIVGPS